jgi:outer membrane receptor protein involved in Fe transport
VHNTLLISALAGSATLPVYAQDAEIEQIVVTGSRIRMANLEGTTPITTVTSADIATQGVTRVEDLITQLPQAFASQNAAVSNGATGAATVDLRNLGDARTLVLINGRRMPYGSTSSSAADLNMIPAAMVERVEVLTGGSSAVYGSDAVAGVVNFIMKKDFEGVQIDGQWGAYQHNNSYGGPGSPTLREIIKGRGETNPSQFRLPGNYVMDGESRELNITMGVSTEDGRGNITAFAGWRENDAVLQGDRDYSACSLDINRPRTTRFNCGGSSTSYPGRFVDFYRPGINFTIDDTTGNTFRPFSSSLDQYNFGPSNYYQRPDERWSLGAFGHYELTDFADVYTELMYGNYTSVAQIAPGGFFLGDAKIAIPCNNPLLSAQQAAALECTPDMIAAGDLATPIYIGRRNVEGGGRQDAFDNSTFRALAGVRGDINDDWNYDASYQYSKGQGTTRTLNYFVLDRIPKAFDVIPDPVTGAAVCRSVLDGTDPACVPYDIFTLGNVTPEALNYLQAPALSQSQITQKVALASISGDLGSIGLKSPFASDAVQVVFGAEWREDAVTTTPDYLNTNALLSGTGGAEIGFSGTTRVTDLFTEVRVPIAQNVPFADQLSFDGAYRYSDYDTGITTDTYKLGLDWAPISDIKFRGSYQRAVRAANVIELFTAQGFNLFDLTADPCSTAGEEGGPSVDACIATGVPANFYDGTPESEIRRASLNSPAGQYNFLQGGVQTLTPEESDTVTIGVVLQPRFLPKLALSVDYYDIKIDNAISTFGADNRLDACYFQADAESCTKINRNPNNGNLWTGDGYVEDLNANLASLTAKGYDISLSYSGIEMGGFGSLNLNFFGTLVDELTTTPAAIIETYDCKGQYSNACGVPTPEWRHRARVGWMSPWNVDAALTWRYYGSVEEFRGNPENIDHKLDAMNYFDLSANWAISEKMSILVGINNVLDEDPPITTAVGTTGNGNTFPQIYDALGRFLFIRAEVGF